MFAVPALLVWVPDGIASADVADSTGFDLSSGLGHGRRRGRLVGISAEFLFDFVQFLRWFDLDITGVDGQDLPGGDGIDLTGLFGKRTGIRGQFADGLLLFGPGYGRDGLLLGGDAMGESILLGRGRKDVVG